MTFKRLSEYFSKLEETTLRNTMVEILAELFMEADAEEIGKLCYLLQGRVAPIYEDIEFGIADKMMIRAVAGALSLKSDEVVKIFKIEGDLGSAAAKLKFQNSPASPGTGRANFKATAQNLKVTDVYEILYKVAKTTGEGSQERKVTLLADLINQVDSLSARYIVRITLDKLRLGFSDMTILDSLSFMLAKTKELRPAIEKAYNVRPDLGFISETVKEKGVAGLSHVTPRVGTPILMARADRLTSSAAILEKIGRCAVEFKYDGLRLQVHYRKKLKTQSSLRPEFTPRVHSEELRARAKLKAKEGLKKDFVRLYSRNLEDLTEMFPDIVESVKKSVKADEVIFEGEIVAYNPKTGVSIPFQQTMQRRRKYNITQKAAEIPVKLYAFELLYHNGVDYIHRPYSERKALLRKTLEEDGTLVYARETIVEKENLIEDMFSLSIKEGYEGIIAKRLDGAYQAGMRGWNWIKLKRAMSKKLMDTFDVVVMGYTLGEGKRTSFGVGEFLTGVYDSKKDQFFTITKIGTGLTDEQFRELKKRITPLEVKKRPKQYVVDTLLETDRWLIPVLVVEISADEITRSQVHTAGRVMETSKSGKAEVVKTAGYSLRFPRLVDFRDDKKPEDATTVGEIEKMGKREEETA